MIRPRKLMVVCHNLRAYNAFVNPERQESNSSIQNERSNSSKLTEFASEGKKTNLRNTLPNEKSREKYVMQRIKPKNVRERNETLRQKQNLKEQMNVLSQKLRNSDQHIIELTQERAYMIRGYSQQIEKLKQINHNFYHTSMLKSAEISQLCAKNNGYEIIQNYISRKINKGKSQIDIESQMLNAFNKYNSYEKKILELNQENTDLREKILEKEKIHSKIQIEINLKDMELKQALIEIHSLKMEVKTKVEHIAIFHEQSQKLMQQNMKIRQELQDLENSRTNTIVQLCLEAENLIQIIQAKNNEILNLKFSSNQYQCQLQKEKEKIEYIKFLDPLNSERTFEVLDVIDQFQSSTLRIRQNFAHQEIQYAENGFDLKERIKDLQKICQQFLNFQPIIREYKEFKCKEFKLQNCSERSIQHDKSRALDKSINLFDSILKNL